MTRLLLPALLAACFALCILADTGAPATALAQDEAEKPESKATDRRPINDQMTLDEAEALIPAAGEGDEDAIEQLESGRLAYVPVLIRDRRTFGMAIRLLRDELDWVRDMQRWEIELLGLDAESMVSRFDELQDRFVVPEAQLARVIIKAHHLGHTEVVASLVKRDPDNLWVRAARAWTGLEADPGTRVEWLLDVLKPSQELSLWGLVVQPGLMDDDVRRLRYGSVDFAEASCPLYLTPEGVDRLYAMPTEWLYYGFYERLGTLAFALPAEQREGAREKVAAGIGEDHAGDRRYLAFLAGAYHGEPTGEVEFDWQLTNFTRGVMSMRYALTSLREDDLSRRLSAIATWWGFHDWRPAQQWLLKEAFASGDAAFARIVIRAILAMCDDDLRGIVSISEALAENSLLVDERKAFTKALTDTKQARLLAVAKAMKGTGAFPDTRDNAPLGLGVEHKAALLSVFMHADELKAYGGAEPAWWMNLSQFLFAQNRTVAAAEAGFRSIELAAGGSERRVGQLNAYLTYRTLCQQMPYTEVPGWIAPWEEDFPLAHEILTNIRKVALGEEVEGTEDVELATYAVEVQLRGEEEASEEQLEVLDSDYSIAGGFGLVLAAWVRQTERDFKGMQERLIAAERVTPTDQHLYWQVLPPGDWFGRFRFRDWTIAEHLTQCVMMLKPYAWWSFHRAGGLLARAGSDPRGISALFLQATDRPQMPYYYGFSVRGLSKMLFARPVLSMLIKLQGAVHGEKMNPDWESTYIDALQRLSWGLDWWDSMQWPARFSPHPGFLNACIDYEYNNRDKRDVNQLLDYALELQGVAPERALLMVERAEEIGVSAYGHFVGAQSFIRAKAQLGEYDEAIARWKKLRDGDVGYPPYLDYMLLHGLLEGNRWQDVDKALGEIRKFSPEVEGVYFPFAMRRAMMTAGKYSQVGKVPEPNWVPRSGDGYNVGNYTSVFYEARQLLEEGELEELYDRATELWSSGCDVSVGVILDAMLLRCLAGKLNPPTAGEYKPDDEGRLRVLPKADLWWFRPGETLDYRALEIMAGERAPDELPEIGEMTWHGLRYGERPQQYKGAGLMREGEALARDRFIRGMLAFFAEDREQARKELQACVDADQRCSHEWHIAEWLLKHQLKK